MFRPTPILTALAAAGCVIHVDGEQPLSDERREIVDNLLEDEPIITAMVLELAKRMEEGAVTEHGAPGNAEDLTRAIANTATWLRTLHARGAIMEADPSLLVTPDTVAQYDAEGTESDSDDRIVVSTESWRWSLETIIHEAGHRFFLHDLTVTRDIQESGAELNAGFADAIITHRDYAYLLTALYAIPSSLARENREAINAARDRHEAPNVLTAEEAETALRANLADNEGMFAQFGLTVDDVVDAYRESGMEEHLARERSEARREAMLEHMQERIDAPRK